MPFSNCFAGSPYNGHTHHGAAARVVPRSSFQGTTHSVSASSPHSSELREHLRFILIYFAHLLARCVLRYHRLLRDFISGVWECSNIFPYKLTVNASLLYTISAYKSFHRRALLSHNRRNPHLSPEGLQILVMCLVSFSSQEMQTRKGSVFCLLCSYCIPKIHTQNRLGIKQSINIC